MGILTNINQPVGGQPYLHGDFLWVDLEIPLKLNPSRPSMKSYAEKRRVLRRVSAVVFQRKRFHRTEATCLPSGYD